MPQTIKSIEIHQANFRFGGIRPSKSMKFVRKSDDLDVSDHPNHKFLWKNNDLDASDHLKIKLIRKSIKSNRKNDDLEASDQGITFV